MKNIIQPYARKSRLGANSEPGPRSKIWLGRLGQHDEQTPGIPLGPRKVCKRVSRATMPNSKFDPQKHRRRSIRLKGYDYSSEGAYYVTIVVQGRECLFGEITGGDMYLNEYGEIVQKWWDEIPIHFPNVDLGAFVIMPNHIHGIIFITPERRGEVVSPPNNPIINIQAANVATNNLGGETLRDQH